MRLGGGAGDGTVEGVLGIVAVAVGCDAAGGAVAPHAPTSQPAIANTASGGARRLNHERLARLQAGRSAAFFSDTANSWNAGPRSGIDFQIIPSIGPLYSSRIWNRVSPFPAGVSV